MTSLYPYGFERMICGFFDSTTGAFIGKASTLANGASSGGYVQNNVKAAGLQPVASSELQIQGGDRIRAVVNFKQTKLASFEVTVSDLDPTLITLINGGAKNTGNSKFTKFHTNPNRITMATMFFALQSPMTDEDGNSYYRTLVIPKARAKFEGGGFSFRDVSDSKITISPMLTTKSYTGESYGVGGLAFGAEENKLDHYYLQSDNPLHFSAARRTDTSALTVTTDYLPLSSVITLNATPNELVAAGAPLALTSFSVTTGAEVIPAGGAAGDIGVLTYETAYVPSS
jgi:hypothetical protein